MEKAKCTNCGGDNGSRSKYCNQCGYELPKKQTEIIEPQIAQKPTSTQDKKDEAAW